MASDEESHESHEEEYYRPEPIDPLPDQISNWGANLGKKWSNFIDRVFGSRQFLHLWSAQLVTSLGDWLGFLALAIVAGRVGANPDLSIAMVMATRLVPGLFFTPMTGVLADRFDRRRLMILCDVARAGIFLFVPFVNSLWALIVASLVIEAFTLAWIPAKEALVPNLLRKEHLTTANSLSMLATYGMFPIASLVLVGVQSAAANLENSGFAQALRLEKEAFAFYINSLTFLISALLLFAIRLPESSLVGRKFAGRPSGGWRDFLNRFRSERSRSHSARFSHRILTVWQQFLREVRDGWKYVFHNDTVRPIGVGLAMGLIGGGMLVPLGLIYIKEILGLAEKEADRAWGIMTTGLGVGVALGVGVILLVQQKLNKELMFTSSVFGAGVFLLLAASLNSLIGVAFMAGGLGMSAGGIYVVGFTLLHSNTADELRGRVFAGLYSIVRLCLVLALVLGPSLSSGLDALSNWLFDGSWRIGVTIPLPGVRLTLWLSGLVIVVAGLLVRRLQKQSADPGSGLPADPADGGAPSDPAAGQDDPQP